MYERILVPVDGSDTAQRGLGEAIALAGRLGSSLRLLHVVDARLLMVDVSMTMPPQQLLDGRSARLAQPNGRGHRVHEACCCCSKPKRRS